MTDQPPPDFQPFGITDGFIGHNGPYFWRQNPEGGFEFGFQTDDRHGNPNGVLHGGAVLTFLDTILGHAVVHEAKRPCATVSLDSRFIATVPPGAWVGGRATMKKLTRTFAFVDAEAFCGDKLLVTATAIFRIFEQ
ncbi:PaaI family thioesterase [Bradyrhizobium sp.]|uniref:PaaI family thioesterase n=1 Tax=Bradyrhizobium sp. TaxID=376 RepID=UPI00238963A9|nr:PaaI family thioesterase [Bradyrhizobium sp.]MDE2377690.1 PaaI family thioesterase [Bradyrhizobium sp.]